MFSELESALTHPVTAHLSLVVLAVLAVFWTLMSVSPDKPVRTSILSNDPNGKLHKVIAIIIFPVGLAVFFAALWEFYLLARTFPESGAEPSEVRWHASLLVADFALLGGVATLYFGYIRVLTTERQTRAAEATASHNEDVKIEKRFSDALSDLHAQRKYTKKLDTSAGPSYVEIWEDDVVKRSGAIDRLQEIGETYPEFSPRVIRALDVYLREVSRNLRKEY